MLPSIITTCKYTNYAQKLKIKNNCIIKCFLALSKVFNFIKVRATKKVKCHWILQPFINLMNGILTNLKKLELKDKSDIEKIKQLKYEERFLKLINNFDLIIKDL